MGYKSMLSYEKYLNELRPTEPDLWVIGGKDCFNRYYPHRYGTALRKNDNIAFEVGYQDYKRY